MYFSVDNVDVSSIKKGHLTNSGLLSASLVCGGVGADEDEGVIFKLNLVVNVVLNDGEYIRTIYNPLE